MRDSQSSSSQGLTASDMVAFVALLATALAMGAALAHALEFPNKIELSPDNYLIVQTAYRGWSLLAFLLVIEVAAMLWLAVRYRAVPRVFWPTVAALACVAAAQAIFWIWTFPANQVTDNWTVLPDNFETLRAQWEYSHLAGAAFQVLAMAAIAIAVIARCSAREAVETP
ncbi:DUF1772 domain-containing protein [Bradyrhizobium sp. LHD-71]|uniref:DUF1772 domain-containing protein n=1 Tax=Bradyrhizobium sp. LHD-71 TaxID=3072141 RepID=UPI00280D069E|nr:DUF1772 domain-containing protein [Bradyrhizobium sp. LHD-71]MDQ8729353.1 DUF1772 domain-containing protein [Bradyrhizobium sp. LHD-71]